VVDYGCGSGILAIAAAKLGAASVLATDIDPQALIATRDNAGRNDVGERIAITENPALGYGSTDVLLANILAGPLVGLPPGGSLLLVNGVPTGVIIAPNAPSSPNGLVITGDGFTMRLAGLNAQGRPLALSSDGGALVLEQDRTAQVDGTGFQPNSEVRLFMFSTPRYIGSVSTDASGNFTGKVPIPPDFPAGRHTLQANGYSPDSKVRSMSIGVIVQEDKAPRVRVAQATVTFPAYSAQLSAVAKAQLRALLRGRMGSAMRTLAVGYVQPSDSTSNDQRLSTARARAVQSYLRSLGLKGPLAARGDGIAKESGAAGRKVVVSIRYTK